MPNLPTYLDFIFTTALVFLALAFGAVHARGMIGVGYVAASLGTGILLGAGLEKKLD